jgi:integrase/recombinase XerD
MKASLELSSKKNREGLFEIYIRVQDGTKKKRIKANVAVSKNQFKSKNHNLQWVRNHPNSKKINADLKFLIDGYNDVLLSETVSKNNITPENIIYKANKGKQPVIFVDYLKSKISQMLEYNLRKGYVQALNNWLKYTEKEKLGNLEFKQIDVFILKGFENYLFKKGLKSYTVNGNLKCIRSCFNKAIKEQLIDINDYVFKAYTMPKVNVVKKERLTVDELKLFSKKEYENGSLIKTAQQIFLLSFNLAGVRIEDVLTLRWSDIKDNRIEYTMSKTGAINSHKITENIELILNYFKSIHDGKRNLIVPVLDEKIAKLKYSKIENENESYKKEVGRKTSLINKYLEKIAKDLNINKKIRTHIARHTFASIASTRTNGDIIFIQNALKHSSSKITQAYLTNLDTEVLDDKMGVVTNL